MNAVTVNLTSDLSTVGMQYTVTMASGVIKDASNNAFAGLSGTAYQFTVADTAAPTITAYSPTQGATGVSASANILLTFNENVQAGTGDVSIDTVPATSTITITVGGSEVTFSSNVMTINPPSSLPSSATYTVALAAGSVTDASTNPFSGLSTRTYEFTVVVPTPSPTATPTATPTPAPTSSSESSSGGIANDVNLIGMGAVGLVVQGALVCL